MEILLVYWLFATLVHSFPQFAANNTSSDPLDALQTCSGTSTYAFTPRETVTITVTDEYQRMGNGTAGDLYFTPPPPCVQVVNNGASTSTTETLTETSSSTDCSTDTSLLATSTNTVTTTTNLTTTLTRGPPYSNDTLTTITVCSTIVLIRTSVRGGTYGPWTTNEGYTLTKAGSTSKSFFPPPIDQGSKSNPSFVPPITAPFSSDNSPPGRITVTVTKKTPAPGPASKSNDENIPTFPTGPAQPDAPTGGSGGRPGETVSNAQPPNTQPREPQPTFPATVTTVSNNNNNAAPTPGIVAGPDPTRGGGIGSIINSAINSPFQTVGVSTSFGSATPTVNLVDGIPVQVGPSSIFIGGQNIALPSAGQTELVTVNGQTITVAPNLVMGGSDSITIQRPESVSSARIVAIPLAASTITQDGIVVTIEPEDAIISGQTFRIGINAPATSTVVNSQTIIFNSNGVVFSSTTYRPAMTTQPPYVVTTIGKFVFSIDQSEAVISGTTYRIGAGALNSATTKVLDGTTIVFGPSGIVLPSTTIAPTEMTSLTSTAASAGTKAVQNTASATSSSAAAPSSRSPTFLSDFRCFSVLLLASLTLPLSILL